jgi:hypothetical protein
MKTKNAEKYSFGSVLGAFHAPAFFAAVVVLSILVLRR